MPAARAASSTLCCKSSAAIASVSRDNGEVDLFGGVIECVRKGRLCDMYPPPADHLPNQLVTKNKENLKIDGVKIELLHWAPAHTSGDLVVYLPSDKIVFTGDIIAASCPIR